MLETSAESPASVAAISQLVGQWVARLGPIWIEGELSEVKVRPGSPVIFMRLRDTTSDMSISLMCYKDIFDSVPPLTENARIVINSKVSWYPKNGSLAFQVAQLRQVGVGELMSRLEALKNQLAAEGLFDADRKVALPFLPKVIGLICGRNSDAEKDVVENARRRWPSVQFEIIEVAVANANAVVEVSSALRELEANSDVEVIIITRGGGNFEDLLPFSDESLIRLAASCRTPIVSAIGHEKDAPLLDLVADWRASTPTDAGKRVVPDMAEELTKLTNMRERAIRNISNRINFETARIQQFMDRPSMREPITLVITRLEVITNLRARSQRSTSARFAIATKEISSLSSQVRTLSPQATLKRGYAVIQKADGSVVRSASQLTKGELLKLRLAEGSASAVTE
ncbi:MAG: exodeoxyribonuclease VII large subunit [Actinomycetales bacterium]|nr:MAG: exodeoxyribonuclease VII large subunit [Actinomycetales bacterium]